MTDEEHVKSMLVIAWVTEPVDHLWRLLQYTDSHQVTLVDLCSAATNPFHIASQALCSMLVGNMDSGHLRPLAYHFSNFPDKLDSVVTMARFMSVSISGQLWYFVDRIFNEYPFRLLDMLGCRDLGDKLHIAEAFFAVPSCCLEPLMARKLRAWYTSAQDMAQNADLVDILWAWASATRISNMEVERLLALIKQASPQKPPLLESVCSRGLLAQFAAQHRSAGGSDPRYTSRSGLLRDDVPLRSATKERKTDRRGKPCWMMYAMDQERSAPRGYANRAERYARMRELAQEFKDMDPASETHRYYTTLAGLSRQARHAAPAPAPAPVNNRRDSSALWGLASDELPIDNDRFVAGLRAEAGLDDGADVAGFASYSMKLRKSFNDGLFVMEQGQPTPPELLPGL